jgi:hypothetical protein
MKKDVKTSALGKGGDVGKTPFSTQTAQTNIRKRPGVSNPKSTTGLTYSGKFGDNKKVGWIAGVGMSGAPGAKDTTYGGGVGITFEENINLTKAQLKQVVSEEYKMLMQEYIEYLPPEMRSPEFWKSPDANERYEAYEKEHGSRSVTQDELEQMLQRTGATPDQEAAWRHEYAADQTLAAIQGKGGDEEEYKDVTGQIVHGDGSTTIPWSGAGALKKAGADPKPVEKSEMSSRPNDPFLDQQRKFYASGGMPGGGCAEGKECVGREFFTYHGYVIRSAEQKKKQDEWDAERLRRYRAKKAEEEQGLQELKLTTPQLKQIIDEILRGM